MPAETVHVRRPQTRGSSATGCHRGSVQASIWGWPTEAAINMEMSCRPAKRLVERRHFPPQNSTFALTTFFSDRGNALQDRHDPVIVSHTLPCHGVGARDQQRHAPRPVRALPFRDDAWEICHEVPEGRMIGAPRPVAHHWMIDRFLGIRASSCPVP